MKLFCYGTLKSGYGLNHVLDGCPKVADAIVPGYRLVFSHGRGSFPFAVPDPEALAKGEVYEVDPEGPNLKSIDRIEGHPTWYVRTPAKTIDGDDVELYVMNRVGNAQDCNNIDNVYEWSR